MGRIIDIAGGDYLVQAIAALENGECVAMPTETVYGLAGDATNGIAVARIFEMKGRPRFNPLIAHVGGLGMARKHGVFGAAAEKLATAFWPGPLTLVVPKKPESDIHDLVTAGLSTIALRMPRGPARQIISEFGRPLAVPSANRSGRVSPTTAAHVAEEFTDTDLMILDNGPCPVGLESTIVKIGPDRLTLLRPGAITGPELTAITDLPVGRPGEDAEIEAPGMLKSHYAPDAELRLNVTDCPSGAALLAFGDGAGKNRTMAGHVLNLSPRGDLKEAAANLYHHLKALDATGFATICVEPIPATGIGAAINDRLARAAAPRSKN